MVQARHGLTNLLMTLQILSRPHESFICMFAGYDAQSEVDQMWDQLRARDAQILMLQKKLGHLRTWVASLHGKVAQMNPQALKNSRRLYVGGVPIDTSEVSLRRACVLRVELNTPAIGV